MRVAAAAGEVSRGMSGWQPVVERLLLAHIPTKGMKAQ
jgi:hypothetical protein